MPPLPSPEVQSTVFWSFFLFFNEMVGPYSADTQCGISRSLMVKASDIFGFDKNIK